LSKQHVGEPAIEHEYAQELHQIRALISEHPEIFDLVHVDLIRGLGFDQKLA